MDILITLLDHGYDDLEGIESAEFVLNHSQWISVVTGTSSVYGVLEETRLTSTHPFNNPKPGITLVNVQENPPNRTHQPNSPVSGITLDTR